MDWCGHTKALSGYPLQTPSNMVESCYVMLGYVRLNQKMSNAVKHSQTLSNASDSKLLAPFVFRFSDKLINSIQLHSTPLKHHDTNYSIDPVPPASKGGQDSPESPWKKKLGCCDGNCSRLINELVLTKISGNIPKPGNFTMKHRGLLQIFPSDQKIDEPVDRKSGKVVGTSIGYTKQHWLPMSFGPGNATSGTIKSHQESSSCMSDSADAPKSPQPATSSWSTSINVRAATATRSTSLLAQPLRLGSLANQTSWKIMKHI